MKAVFVIRNHHGQFLGKQGQWLDDSEAAAVYRSPHHDVALNHLIEANARDIEQRLLLLQCPLNDRDVPLLGDAEVPRKAAVTFDEPEPAAISDSDEQEEQENEGADEPDELLETGENTGTDPDDLG